MNRKLFGTVFAAVLIIGCAQKAPTTNLEAEWKAEVTKRGAPFKAEIERLIAQGKKPGITDEEMKEVLHKMEAVNEMAYQSMKQFRDDWNSKHPEAPMPSLDQLGIKQKL